MTQYSPCPTCPTSVSTNTEAYHGCVDCMKRKIQKLEKKLEAREGTLNAVWELLQEHRRADAACLEIRRLLNYLRKDT